MDSDLPPIVVNEVQAVDQDRVLLGGKGAGLFWMASLGVPVPPFFMLTTRAWREWDEAGQLLEPHTSMIMEMIRWLEQRTGRTFGRGPRPLLVSVRSAGMVSMPGMMDTILNLGLTPEALGALHEEFRSLQIVGDVITTFVDTATPVFASQHGGKPVPRPVIPVAAQDQLVGAIEGVFASWNNHRARLYRRINRIPDEHGTAIVVQAMVFGNADAESGAGVLFTRDPVTGSGDPRGEWVAAAQGEAIVSGRMTPAPVHELACCQPDVFDQLLRIARCLEREAGEPQDIEFTVERGKLFLLQTRALKHTPLAGCRIVLALLDEGSITRDEAIQRLSSIDFADLAIEALVQPPADELLLATGLPASPGIAHGVVARDVGSAPSVTSERHPLVLLRPETSPHDLPVMRRAAALVTERGGLTSHAAIIARELRIPCVVGCGDLDSVRSGGEVTVDGAAGRLYAGRLATERSVPEIVRRARSLVAEGEEVSTT
ncbi:MAG: pyruvate, phosphate dikinase [Pseudonocardiaceae bacterium]|nr:pyruvate, phosphate dikinase [Pseudonocardiaceae bacterium]